MTPEDVSTYCGRVYAILIVDPDNSFEEFYEFNNYASQMVLLRCASNGNKVNKCNVDCKYFPPDLKH